MYDTVFEICVFCKVRLCISILTDCECHGATLRSKRENTPYESINERATKLDLFCETQSYPKPNMGDRIDYVELYKNRSIQFQRLCCSCLQPRHIFEFDAVGPERGYHQWADETNASFSTEVTVGGIYDGDENSESDTKVVSWLRHERSLGRFRWEFEWFRQQDGDLPREHERRFRRSCNLQKELRLFFVQCFGFVAIYSMGLLSALLCTVGRGGVANRMCFGWIELAIVSVRRLLVTTFLDLQRSCVLFGKKRALRSDEEAVLGPPSLKLKFWLLVGW